MTRRKQRETGGRALKIEGNANTKALKWKESVACSKDRNVSLCVRNTVRFKNVQSLP